MSDNAAMRKNVVIVGDPDLKKQLKTITTLNMIKPKTDPPRACPQDPL